MPMCFDYLYICAPHASMVPWRREVGIEFPRTGVTEVVSTVEVLRTKPVSSVRAASAFCPFAITHAPSVLLH